MKMHEQLAAAALRISQGNTAAPASHKAAQRRVDKLRRNLGRRYVHLARPLQECRGGGLDFVHQEMPVDDTPGALVKRFYYRGSTYAPGNNARKRAARESARA